MRVFFFLLCVACLGSLSATELESPSKRALDRLRVGNQRYTHNKTKHRSQLLENRESVANAQTPFATILGCADSRVAPEIIFDQGIGDLFVVRVAGNVAGPLEVDSIEYAVSHLGTPLLLVLGHEGCGAISAVVKGQTGDIEDVAHLIQPAVDVARKTPGNLLNNAIIANVRLVVERLKKVPVIAQLVQEGKLEVLGGYYHLRSGKVNFLR